MSNSELFSVKDHQEDIIKLDIVKIPNSKLLNRTRDEACKEESFDSNSIEEAGQSLPKDDAKEDEEEENDGFRTPTSWVHRIPETKKCPPAPTKRTPHLKRKTSSFRTSNAYRSLLLDLSKEVDSLCPILHSNIKRARCEIPINPI